METRRTGTHNLVAGDRRPRAARPQVLVSQSAVGYYGDRGDDRASTSRAGPAARASTPRSSWSGSRRRTRSRPTGVRLVDRPHRPGPRRRRRHAGELLPPFKLGVGGPLAGGDQYLSWIHIDDEVGILLWALDNESGQRRRQRDRAEPGDQQGLLEGAGPGARTARRWCRSPASSSTSNSAASSARCCEGGQRVMPKRALELGYEFKPPGPRRGAAGPALATQGFEAPRGPCVRGGAARSRPASPRSLAASCAIAACPELAADDGDARRLRGSGARSVRRGRAVRGRRPRSSPRWRGGRWRRRSPGRAASPAVDARRRQTHAHARARPRAPPCRASSRCAPAHSGAAT